METSVVTPRKRLWKLLAVLLAMLAVVAACGGGDDDETSTETTVGDAEEAPAADGDDAVADFYSGKTVSIVVATEPGGGFDTIARIVAQYMPKYIPGEPTMIVENMPGAGHLVGWNHVTNVAPADGTVIGNANGSLVLQQLLGADGVEFDMTKLYYLGEPDAPVNMVLVANASAGVTDVHELIDGDAGPLIIGTTAPGDVVQDSAVLLEKVAGANVKIVSGYDGGGVALAMEQGEADGWFTSSATLAADYQDKVESGEWVVLVQTNAEPEDGLEDVPTLISLVDSEDDQQLMQIGAASRGYVRPYFLREGVPEDRAAALREAFEKTMADPEFLADAERAGRVIDPVDGDELFDVYSSFINDTSTDQAERLSSILGL